MLQRVSLDNVCLRVRTRKDSAEIAIRDTSDVVASAWRALCGLDFAVDLPGRQAEEPIMFESREKLRDRGRADTLLQLCAVDSADETSAIFVNIDPLSDFLTSRLGNNPNERRSLVNQCHSVRSRSRLLLLD